ncbi:MAG: signal peptidase I [Candidatus Aminicenantes bacterium]|nr:signal peptidase I [Candidatus Aminicenantes bacterium]
MILASCLIKVLLILLKTSKNLNNIDLFLELSRNILQKRNSVRFQVKGRSMFPFLQDEDFIIVSPIKNSSIKPGDVLLYSSTENKVVVHRVIKKHKKDNRMIWSVKGDATSGPPEELDIQNVLGKVVSIERTGKRINVDGGLGRLNNFIYSWFWPLIKIQRVLDRILSLFDPNLFIKKPIDSFQSVAEKYDGKEEVEFHSRILSEGLEKWEKDVITKYVKPKTRILDVGCGAGREAIALTKMGFKVTGIDISPNMINKAIKNAKKEKLNIQFKVQNVADITCPTKSFDYVLFSRAVYSYIPTKKLRVKILKKIKDILKPDGMLFFIVYYKEKRFFSRLNIMGFFRRLRNFFFKKKFESEPGDLLVKYVSPASSPKKLCFCHFFSSPKEVLKEVGAAKLTVLEVKNNSLRIVKTQ